MEAFGLLIYGFSVLLTWKTLALMMVGLVLGIFVGVLPGLGGPNGVAILLPLTFTMDPTSAIVMLSCIYWGALFGGAITSILFNIPGEAWSVATTFDGYPMAQQGKAAEALTAAFTSSFIGSLVAVLLITFLAPGIASFALRFGPPEFFAVYLLTFCSFVGLGREQKHKTVISMALGLLLTGVGMDTVSGQLRMTFGSSDLLRGINFLVAVIGLFGISEILLTMEERLALRGHAASISLRTVLKVWKEMPRYWVTLLRSSAIGCWLGITPGGAIAASFMSYNLAKRFSKDKESFGKGRIEGVFAPETAAHASGTSALLPMLALGIPGSGTAAILLGGLMVWGLNPGPLLFVEHKGFVWGLIASMYLGNVVGLILVLTTVPVFAAVLRVPFSAIAPMIVVSCAIGAYAIQNAMFDIWLMLLFGVVGYVFKKIGIPLAPFTLALVLGSRAEDSFRLSMIGEGGDMPVFWSQGLVGSITTRALDADKSLRCIVIRGAGDKAFAAGADISEFETTRRNAKLAKKYGAVLEKTMGAIARCRHPIVAMIHGVCVGGGLEVITQCDLRICGASSRFGIPIAKLGLVVGYDEMKGLIDLVGRAVALEILLEGRVFGAEEAKDKGLVNRVVPDDKVEEESLAAARRIADGAPLVARWHKKFARRLANPRPVAKGERDEAYACYDTEDFKIGVKAFLAKQKPQFKGK